MPDPSLQIASLAPGRKETIAPAHIPHTPVFPRTGSIGKEKDLSLNRGEHPRQAPTYCSDEQSRRDGEDQANAAGGVLASMIPQ